jgi:hypothetical protein
MTPWSDTLLSELFDNYVAYRGSSRLVTWFGSAIDNAD